MKLLKLFVCAIMILSVTIVSPVFAVETEGDKPTSATITPEDKAATTQEQRIKDRKAESQRKFAQKELALVRSKCASATGLVKSAQSRISSFEVKRTRVHSGLVARLQGLSIKFQAADVDTKTFDEQVAVLKTKADAYDTEITALKQAVDDLAAMDCSADPEGFIATLVEAHKLRTSVIAKGKDFRAYLKDTLKPTFVNIQTQLKAKNTEGEG